MARLRLPVRRLPVMPVVRLAAVRDLAKRPQRRSPVRREARNEARRMQRVTASFVMCLRQMALREGSASAGDGDHESGR